MLGYKDTDKAVEELHCKYQELIKPANSAGLTEFTKRH